MSSEAAPPVVELNSTSKRQRIPVPGLNEDADYLEFMPLGGGQEVGKSCHILKFKGKTIMLDCGVHPAFSGLSCLPFFDAGPKASEIDIILISHFHLDHAAALPYFLSQTDFKGKVYMTHPTKSIFKLILHDYVKVSSISIEEQLYTQTDLDNCMDRIDVMNYHQVIHHKGIKFWCYTAGHVLGAAMFMIEIAGVKILYTGDYSRKEDRHLCAAETPDVKPDILIVEATYGVRTLGPIHKREQHFVGLVHKIVGSQHGNCLIPVFALGKAQELLLILEEYWEEHPSLQKIPIYYASALAKRCMNVYQTYINMMNSNVKDRAQVSNPFMFKYIKNLRGMNDLKTDGPCVVLASPGFLQSGLSRKLLEAWCTDKRNGVIIPGYCVEGTLANEILKEPPTIQSLTGSTLPLNMTVHDAEFSAHADFVETSEFVDALKPPHVILVHGRVTEMGRLKRALDKKYNHTESSDDEDNADTAEVKDAVDELAEDVFRMTISAPKNTQKLELEFRKNKVVSATGSLVDVQPQHDDLMSGLVVEKDFVYTLLAPDDLPEYTALSSAQVRQTLTVPFRMSLDVLKLFIKQMFTITESTRQLETGDAKSPVVVEEVVLLVNESVQVFCHGLGAEEVFDPNKKPTNKTGNHVILEWVSNPVNDMIGDSLVALLLSVETNPGAASKLGVSKCGHDHSHHTVHSTDTTAADNEEDVKMTPVVSIDAEALKCESEVMLWYFQQQFGTQNVTLYTPTVDGSVVANDKDLDHECLSIQIDGTRAVVNLKTMTVVKGSANPTDADANSRKHISKVIRRVMTTEFPLSRSDI